MGGAGLNKSPELNLVPPKVPRSSTVPAVETTHGDENGGGDEPAELEVDVGSAARHLQEAVGQALHSCHGNTR